MPENRVRVIAGRWRRRWIRFPALAGLRPTPDRVRETLFNWLGQDLTGLACLDLFAGSGALGLEAASRGAKQVLLVERDRRIAQALQDNVRALQQSQAVPGRLEVVRGDALEFLAADRRTYDVVFLDPPFAEWESAHAPPLELLPPLEAHLAGGGVVYLESPVRPQLPPGWQAVKQAQAGAVHYQLLEVQRT